MFGCPLFQHAIRQFLVVRGGKGDRHNDRQKKQKDRMKDRQKDTQKESEPLFSQKGQCNYNVCNCRE